MRNMIRQMSRSHPGGFSLLELMIVVSIIGILAAIGIPAFGELIQNNRRTVVVNELISSLSLARTEAAKRGQRVLLCGIDDANNNKIIDDAELSCASNANDGWIVFVDADTGGDVDASEKPPLRQYINDYADITVVPGITSAMSGTVPAGAIALNPFNSVSSNGTITICDPRGPSKARGVVIAPNGRARVSESGLSCP